MKIRVEQADLPDDVEVVGLELEAGLEAPPVLSLTCRLQVTESIPATTDLLGTPLRLSAATERDEDALACIFSGLVSSATVAQDRASAQELHLVASPWPNAMLRWIGVRATWRTFERGATLKSVVLALLQDLGLDGVRLASCVNDETPHQIVGGGRCAWTLLQRILRTHGAALLVRADAGPDSAELIHVVRTGAELAEVGATRRLPQAAHAAADEPRLLRIASTALPSAGTTTAPYLDASLEEAWPEVEGSVVAGPALPTAAAASAVARYARDRLRGFERRFEAVLKDPAVRVGDTLQIEAGHAVVGELRSLVDAELVVTRLRLESAHMAGRMQEGTVVAELCPRQAPLPVAKPDPTGHPFFLTGLVRADAPADGPFEIDVDTPDAAGGGASPVAHVEWTTPWYSGELGGAHAQPLVGDRIIALAEDRPYGRVVLLGAHPGDERRRRVTAFFTEPTSVRAPEDRERAVAGPVELKGSHLARAVIVGSNVGTVWLSPGAGLASAADPKDAVTWSRLEAPGRRFVHTSTPNRSLTELRGSTARYDVRCEGHAAAQIASKLAVRADELAELTAEKLDVLSRTTTTAKSVEATHVIADGDMTLETQKNLEMNAEETFAATSQQAMSFTTKDALKASATDDMTLVTEASMTHRASSAIAIEAGDDLEAKSGSAVKIKGDGSLSAESPKTSVKGTDKAILEGQRVAIEAGGAATLKGSTVGIG